MATDVPVHEPPFAATRPWFGGDTAPTSAVAADPIRHTVPVRYRLEATAGVIGILTGVEEQVDDFHSAACRFEPGPPNAAP
jgi:hypothetical protein